MNQRPARSAPLLRILAGLSAAAFLGPAPARSGDEARPSPTSWRTDAPRDEIRPERDPHGDLLKAA